MPSRHIKSTNPPSVTGGGSTTVIDAFTDTFTVQIGAPDSNASPTDAATFQLSGSYADTNAGHGEAVSLGFPSPDFGDSNQAPIDTTSFTVRAWLSGSAGAGVTNPANANGQNDGANAVISTAIAGPTTETLTSALGVNVPTATISAAIYRGWFSVTVPLGTSTTEVIAQSIGGLFTDVVMFTSATTVSHSTGTFTYDLIAGGINTLAKIQSLRILHRTTDIAAGVSQSTMNVDAGAVEIAGAFT